MPKGKPIPEAVIRAMYAEHLAGERWCDIARKHFGPGAVGKKARGALSQRGYTIRPTPGGGRKQPFIPATELEIEAEIRAATVLRCPHRLRTDWRHWTLAQRVDLTNRLKAALGWKDTRPKGPYSEGVTPFEFGTPEAHAIVEARTKGSPSRHFAARIMMSSVGVIFRGTCYHWNVGTYGYELKSKKRRQESLHRLLYAELHGPIPAGGVIIHADGNRNNFEPGNLKLVDRNHLARTNQAAALQRIAREKTDAILNRHRGGGLRLELR